MSESLPKKTEHRKNKRLIRTAAALASLAGAATLGYSDGSIHKPIATELASFGKTIGSIGEETIVKTIYPTEYLNCAEPAVSQSSTSTSNTSESTPNMSLAASEANIRSTETISPNVLMWVWDENGLPQYAATRNGLPPNCPDDFGLGHYIEVYSNPEDLTGHVVTDLANERLIINSLNLANASYNAWQDENKILVSNLNKT